MRAKRLEKKILASKRKFFAFLKPYSLRKRLKTFFEVGTIVPKVSFYLVDVRRLILTYSKFKRGTTLSYFHFAFRLDVVVMIK